MYKTCRLVTPDANRYIPNSYRNKQLLCKLAGNNISILIPDEYSVVSIGIVDKEEYIRVKSQGSHLGINFSNFVIELSNLYILHDRDIIVIDKDISIIITT